MLTFSLLANVTSAAIAAALTASMSFGHYRVGAGADGAGPMPPASILNPDAPPGEAMDPFADMIRALVDLKLQDAKADRNRAMIDWLTGLHAGFRVQRFETGLVYEVSYPRGADRVHALKDFVAVPYGPEMPFAVRLQAAADGQVRIEGASCTAHRTLGTVKRSAGPEAAETAAISQAEAYLAAPEMGDPSLPADCLTRLLASD